MVEDDIKEAMKAKSAKILEVVLHGCTFSLRRVRDGAGDSGPMFYCIDSKDNVVANGVIRVGCAIQCGSYYARSYYHQDWWLTSFVTEILEVNEDQTLVKVKTGNSEYIIEAF